VQGNIFDSVELLDGANAYDVVSCFEVYEHVPDTEALLDVMESLLTEDGIACVTTPNGAFERGNIQNWQKVDYKGHLRAVPAGDLAEQLSARGDVVDFRVHAGDHLTFAAWKPAERKGSIVFYNGGSAETWSPLSLQEGGIGGSETALVQTAQLLSERGYQVTVYAQCEPGLYGGALWKAHTAFDPSAECDLLVVSRIPYVFDNPIGARRTALWCHDNAYPDLTEARADKIDEVIVLSDWQRDRYAELYPFLADKLRIIRNGVSLTSRRTGKTLIDGSATFYERKPVCVYSSSADRGLDRLLAMWPRIRAEVPDAELHVYYGWNTFDRFIVQNPGLIEFKTHVLNMIAEQGGEEGGIHMLGRVGQRDLSAAMREARVWTYPSYFLETSCIGAMEARAAGLPVVTSKLAALQETVGAHGILLGHLKRDGDRTELTKQYESAFVKQTVRLLSDEAYWTEWHAKALDSIEECDWAARADEWEAVAGLLAPVTA
jgi:glycosyltransferase involved in cell wall biosynthesis